MTLQTKYNFFKNKIRQQFHTFAKSAYLYLCVRKLKKIPDQYFLNPNLKKTYLNTSINTFKNSNFTKKKRYLYKSD